MVCHGGARKEDSGLIDFSYSVNPYRPPFLKDLLKTDLSVYPYCEYLEDKIKEKYRIEGEVVIGAGITELLYMVSFTFKGKEAQLMLHTYGEYERMAKIFKMKINYVKDIDPYFNSFNLKKGVIFFSNPNNPTGKYYRNINELFEIAEKNGSFVILDEAFIDFSKEKNEFYGDNVIVLRSFTKSFGLPGIRAGYAFGERKIIEKMKYFRMPWSMGGLGCKFIEYALNSDSYLKSSIEKIWIERERISLKTGLKTDANFFLAEMGRKGIKEELKKYGLLVRDCTSFHLPTAIRFSIRKKKDNEILLEALEKYNIGIPKGVNYEI